MQAATITTHTKDYDSSITRFRRVRREFAPDQPDRNAHILLSHRLHEGVVGYATMSSVVDGDLTIKFATGRDREALELEASVYQNLGDTTDRPSIPTFYGLFEGAAWHALVISFEGDMVKDFKSLDISCRWISCSCLGISVCFPPPSTILTACKQAENHV